MTRFANARVRSGEDAHDGVPGHGVSPGRLPVPHGHSHVVQFYEGEDFLADVVATYLGAGLLAGQPVIVIATPPHRSAIARRLTSAGLGVEDVRRRGQLTMLDARETLATFMDGDVPDARRFRATLGRVLDEQLGGGRHASVRAFGEMVDLLWRDGNADGAVRLEELWNELGETYAFSLLCAYDMGNFSREKQSPHFEDICRHHTRVAPTERYTAAGDDGRPLEIARLQQRARALEAEVEHRKALEGELREALAEREFLLERAESARAEAEAANRAKSQFLAVMSHELRTPLNAIGGHVQLVELGLHGPVTDAQHDALERVQRSQRQLLALINDVLNLARVESGRVEYALADVALTPLVADVAAMVGPLLSAKGLTCEMSTPAGAAGAPLSARADPEKVRQILLNLLTNAVKFTLAGGRVTVAAGAGAEPAATVCLHVRDTGVGIPADKLVSVFEPFVQVGRGHSPGEGVGLGLSISRHLARGMGGDLTVASTPGVGSVFTLTLPSAE